MSYPVLSLYGYHQLTLKYTAGADTANTIAASLADPPSNFVCYFTSGATGLVKGATLVGATSTASSTIVDVIITSGSLGGNNATGLLFLSATGYSAGENLQVSSSTKAVANGASRTIKKSTLKTILFQVETSPIRYTTDTTVPTGSGGTPAYFGLLANPMDVVPVVGWSNAKNLSWCNSTAGSNAVVNMFFYYGE